MALKSFQHWKRQEVQDTFGLIRRQSMPLLKQWLTVNLENITPTEQQKLDDLRHYLRQYGSDWNEATLKFFFLSPLIRLVNFHLHPYNPFLEHSLMATINGETISGKVDFIVAKGEQIPTVPIFCIHEYKSETGTSNDPFGQLLIAMVAAQQANEAAQQKTPIYGMYVLGNIFYFVLLDEKEYARSLAFDATKADIFDLFAVLKKTKGYISEHIK